MTKRIQSIGKDEPIYKLTAYEKESIILFNEEEKTARVYTHNSNLKKKLEAMTKDNPKECKLYEKNSFQGMTYIIPKSYIRITPPKKMNLTPEQKQILSERMKKMREK